MKAFDRPDRVLEIPGVRAEIVEFGPLAIARTTHEPGWRWSTHVKPVVGTDRCEARHVGYLLSGRMGLELSDGRLFEVGPGCVFDIPPGHDGWTVGDEPIVSIDWTGGLEWLVPAQGERVLAAILFTDIVGSTAHAERVGDRRWRAILSAHDDAVRQLIAAGHGREVTTTGDGFLAVFDGPARAIRTALLIRERVASLGLELRQAIHVGEVELAGGDVHGLAVHEAARILATTGPGEIFVSAVTRALAAGSGYTFTTRGTHELKGFPGQYELFAIAEDGRGGQPRT
jgi:class 3 adenylate cyclase